MLKENTFSKLYFGLIALAIGIIPFSAIPYFIITPLLFIVWIIEKDWARKWNRLKSNKWLLLVLLPALFYSMNIIGLIYSNDLIKGLMRSYDKLPFLIYPLVFLTIKKEYLSQKRWKKLMVIFLISTAFMLFLSWGVAWYQFIQSNSTNAFYYSNFTNFINHPSYAALIVTIAFVLGVYFLTITKRKYHVLLLPFLLLSAITIYFFQSRSGLFVFGLMFLLLLFYLLKSKMYAYSAFFLVALILCFSIIFVKFPYRMDSFVHQIENSKSDGVKSTLGARAQIWSVSWEQAKIHFPMGAGSGYQVDAFLENDELDLMGKNSLFLNTHNQFLQTLLDHGFFGLLFLLAFLIYSIYYSFKTRNFLLFCLLTSTIIHLCFESMFERGQGIFPFMLFYVVFILKKDTFATNNQKNNQSLNKIHDE